MKEYKPQKKRKMPNARQKTYKKEGKEKKRNNAYNKWRTLKQRVFQP
jgi:hypothetical protein